MFQQKQENSLVVSYFHLIRNAFQFLWKVPTLDSTALEKKKSQTCCKVIMNHKSSQNNGNGIQSRHFLYIMTLNQIYYLLLFCLPLENTALKLLANLSELHSTKPTLQKGKIVLKRLKFYLSRTTYLIQKVGLVLGKGH